jgi:hypothetical protein
MVSRDQRLTVDPSCSHLAEDLANWEGRQTDPHKDGIDAWRYITVPLVEGLER